MKKTTDQYSVPTIPDMPDKLKFPVREDLIPVQANQITDKWANETFKYEYIFVEGINQTAYDNETHLDLWKDKARDIQEEIKRTGVSVTVRYICKNMKDRGHVLPNSDLFPTCADDIFKIFGSKDWYLKNPDTSREIIYNYCWGIFRVGRNEWIHDYVTEWLDERNLQLENTLNPSGRNTRKNFVYVNFCKKIGTMLSDRIIATLTRNFGEDLCCHIKGSRESYHYCEIKGMNGQCYLVTQEKKSMTGDTDVVLKRKLEQLVEETYKLYAPTYIYSQLKEIYKQKGMHEGKQIAIESKGKNIIDCEHLVYIFACLFNSFLSNLHAYLQITSHQVCVHKNNSCILLCTNYYWTYLSLLTSKNRIVRSYRKQWYVL